MDVDSLLKKARETWGDDKLDLNEVLVRLGVVFGDMCRAARTKQECGEIDEEDLKKEMGNVIYSMIRWCDDLGFDPQECIALAQQAQSTYTSKLL